MARLGHLFPAFALAAATFVSLAAGGCSGKGNGTGLGAIEDPATEDDGGFSGIGRRPRQRQRQHREQREQLRCVHVGDGYGATPANCPASQGLSCYVSTCANGKHTTLTGHVYDPAGKNPLYNVVVFVPNDPSTLPAIETGTKTCNTCNTPIGDYVTVTLTDQTGAFTLKDVPTGKNVPLVMQVGKWRRTISVADIADCATTAVPESGPGQARLPANQSEGSMPKMALLTGGQDDLGCFMTRMGIASSEYSAPGGARPARHLPGPERCGVSTVRPCRTARPATARDTGCPLWQSTSSLEAYDIVLLACEGGPMDPDAPGGFGGNGANVTKAGKQAMHDWLNEGGKVFATHFHYTWFEYGPADFQTVATWLGSSIALGVNGTGTIDTSFTKGQEFGAWLKIVGRNDRRDHQPARRRRRACPP